MDVKKILNKMTRHDEMTRRNCDLAKRLGYDSSYDLAQRLGMTDTADLNRAYHAYKLTKRPHHKPF